MAVTDAVATDTKPMPVTMITVAIALPDDVVGVTSP